MSTALEIPDILFIEESSNPTALLADFQEIRKFYEIYREGADWKSADETKDFTPAELRFKISASLINKQARFLFAEPPDILVEPNDGIDKLTEADETAISRLESLVRSILYENRFEEALIKAAKDCFIGKRVAGVVNFDEEHGVTLSFIPALQFLFETSFYNSNVIEKFVYFRAFFDSDAKEKRVYKKKYTLEEGIVFVAETIHDPSGDIVEVVLEKTPTLLAAIPVSVFINDGLTGDTDGESEIALLEDFESWHSRMSNADIDAGRANMNPIRYAIDMEPESTKGLKSRPGEFWDLATNQNADKESAKVGILENSMNYSEPLKTTLDRIKTSAFEQVDVPNITLETMAGVITSGKSLKALYWSLIIRCKEKMKVWGPQLRLLVKTIIDGSYQYPNCIQQYIAEPLLEVDYEVKIVQNHSLPEDEMEEMSIDLQNVESKTMSKKAYMQKWRGLTDDQVEDELRQIGLERQILEDFAFQESVASSQESEYRRQNTAVGLRPAFSPDS